MTEPKEHRILITSWLMDQIETVPIGIEFYFEFAAGLIKRDMNPGDICTFEVIQAHEESEPSYKVRARFCGAYLQQRRKAPTYQCGFELISFELPPCPSQSTP